MKLKTLTQALVLSSTLMGGIAMSQTSATVIEIPAQTIQLTQEWDKTFPKSDQVNHRKVTFKNRYGIVLAADLYIPKNHPAGKLPAIAVSGPFGAVKEQSSGLYAQTLAERGFVTLAFDPSYTGESSGLPRDQASPEINTEDFSAAVDFLGSLDEVDRDKIGILGVCGWGGFALNAAAIDTRIKAVATSTMYDMTRVMRYGYNDSNTPAQQEKMKQDLNNARWEAAQTAYSQLGPNLNIQADQITEDTPEFIAGYSRYYTTKRGYHPRSINSTRAWTTVSALAFLNMPILQHADEINIPTLIVAGEKAHSRYFSEDAFKQVGSHQKELVIVPNAVHTDLYDNLQKIPFDKFEAFFKTNLN
ncbi:alpha/beta hydrolase [Basilea psittacipulmonis]|uniref:Membrane protein n=1 Tax=Basilea psittacipulmonis DSM 24701 TaxID=1072685 RepID=A0A077DIE9_9BURK|nr:alpha/beta hydrolase [Basilea psittacipulmonis]AIL32948.1 membrane protein [Basilea psittacipulmonis DSM 24701]